MKRRSFVKASLITGAAGSIMPKAGLAASTYKKSDTEFYELRIYSFKNETQQKQTEDYFQHIFIPALNHSGSKNVGVFTELKPDGQTKLCVLIPYRSMDDFLSVQNKLAEETSKLGMPLTGVYYDRIESSLLKAFTGMPKIEVPEQKARIFELRRYESPNETAGKRKIAMFNEGGEIGIFKRHGFNPVFYSEMLIGEFRPNLVYMVTFEDMNDHDQKWKAFGSDPDWVHLKSLPEYPDELVSRITSTFLIPTVYSQI